MGVWLTWLTLFYLVWASVCFSLGLWDETLNHWPIALAMALGSYVAGSTPMGGGTVGFPVLVLLFDMPASLGRNFGLMVQSIGMTSASIFIFCRRTPIELPILGWCTLGAALGLVSGTFLIVPLISDTTVKIAFACLWASFGVLTLIKNREFCSFDQITAIHPVEARNLGLLIGVLGGVTTSLTGVGIDMMLYTLLVLLYRMDLKVAVPTSVVIMAASSVMGTLLHIGIGDLGAEAFYNWMAASPIVILGAPLGAFLVSVISRVKTLYFVAVLCILQFFWTLTQVPLNAALVGLVVVNLAVASVGFLLMYRLGAARLRL
ncbi:MAG: sulfite exporter TauE/SafE family protein [Myxococcales bacterium]|nr:sulfite exporter TauE/SafE family protein [Myxococcales bacterium]MCB9755720.1 sulfite exporter TauE/SafE family protein [Myxococcales bacterium]